MSQCATCGKPVSMLCNICSSCLKKSQEDRKRHVEEEALKMQRSSLRANDSEAGSSAMQILGFILLLVSVVLVVIGFTMDTSVSTFMGGRVTNISLMNQQSNLIVFGGLLLVTSFLLIIFGRKRDDEPREAPSAMADKESLEAHKGKLSDGRSIADDLAKLSALKETGALTDDEYQRAKERLLATSSEISA